MVNNVGGFDCMPGFDRNVAHFIFGMFWVILFGCYFMKICMLYMFFDCEIDGAFSLNKILYEGVTVFDVFVFRSNLKRKI